MVLNRIETSDLDIKDIECTSFSNDTIPLKRFGIQCIIAGFFCNFTIFGIGFTYGIFQEYYLSSDGPLRYEDESLVAIIGTTATSLVYLGVILQGKVRKYLKTFISMAVGSFVLSLGLIIASFCSKTWQFSLTQGLMFGIGSSLVYMPPTVYSPQYFNKYRGIAMWISFSGSGIGSLIFAFLTKYLMNIIGWKWTLRTLGLIGLIITLPCSFIVVPHPDYEEKKVSMSFYVHTFKSFSLYLQLFCGLFQSLGYLIPLTFMSTYAITLGFTSNQGATFIAINNVVNACSKILLGLLADYIGKEKMQLICCAGSMVAVYALWLVPQKGTYTAFVVIYGIFSGPIISLLPACISETFGIEVYYSISGFLYLCRGIGNYLGSPIAGLLLEDSKVGPSNYFGVIQYTGVAFFCATACSISFNLFLKYDKRIYK